MAPSMLHFDAEAVEPLPVFDKGTRSKLKCTVPGIPRSYWGTSMHILGTMPGYGGMWSIDMVMPTSVTTKSSCCNCAATTHCTSWALSCNIDMCTGTCLNSKDKIFALLNRFTDSLNSWFSSQNIAVSIWSTAQTMLHQAEKTRFEQFKCKTENWFSANAYVPSPLLENAAYLQHKLRPSRSSSKRLK